MSTQLHQATLSILSMPYYKNEHAHSGTVIHGHEDAVAIKLLENGFVEDNKLLYPD